MHLKRTLLGATLVLIFALAATSASPARAAEYHHEAEGGARFLATNEGAHEFTLGAIGTLSCNTATFTGTEYVSSSVEELEFSPAFSGCTFLKVSNVSISMNGCKFKFGPPRLVGPDEWDALISIICPAGKKITFTASGCTIEIGSQSTLTLALIGNLLTDQIQLKPQATNLTYTASLLCPGETGTHSNGTYEGTAITSGQTEGEEAVGVYVE